MESLIKNISINVLENVVGNKTGPRIETLVRSSLLAQFQHILNTMLCFVLSIQVLHPLQRFVKYIFMNEKKMYLDSNFTEVRSLGSN